MNPVTAHAVYANNPAFTEANFSNQRNFVPSDAPMTPDAAIFSNVTNETSAREFLKGSGWPTGLIETCIKNLTKIPIRFFICDDSGSMITNDGHRNIMQSNGKPKSIACSRWSELTTSLKFHANLARSANAPTEFRMLNGAPPILIGAYDDPQSYDTLMGIFDASPHGATPLCHHIRQIIERIRGMEQQLRANRQLACVMIATDGVSSDGDIAAAMAPLKHLPAWVVIRMCTDDDKIVEYWNNIDQQVEIDMDVLDDLSAEAAEVTSANNWLTYGEPLHRLREFGIPVKEIDILDSDLLSLEQTRMMCTIIFGGRLDDYPHPEEDWKEFISKVDSMNKQAGKVWAPNKNKYQDWINTSRLSSLHKKGGCVVM
jgi:hypothetical protein